MARRSIRGDLLRRALAQEAARIIVDHGVDDYLFAKRKAAERMGVTDHAVLPRNTEIEEAIAELKAKNVKLQSETWRTGHGGSKIVFLDPSSTGNCVIELAELAPGH